jgi:hypothetical protein
MVAKGDGGFRGAARQGLGDFRGDEDETDIGAGFGEHVSGVVGDAHRGLLLADVYCGLCGVHGALGHPDGTLDALLDQGQRGVRLHQILKTNSYMLRDDNGIDFSDVSEQACLPCHAHPPCFDVLLYRLF